MITQHLHALSSLLPSRHLTEANPLSNCKGQRPACSGIVWRIDTSLIAIARSAPALTCTAPRTVKVRIICRVIDLALAARVQYDRVELLSILDIRIACLRRAADREGGRVKGQGGKVPSVGGISVRRTAGIALVWIEDAIAQRAYVIEERRLAVPEVAVRTGEPEDLSDDFVGGYALAGGDIQGVGGG